MATVRIRVGASLDANTGAVFRPVIDAAKKARQAIDAELGAAGRSLGKSFAGGGATAKRAVGGLRTQAKKLKEDAEHLGSMTIGTKMWKDYGREASTSFALVKQRFDALARAADGDARKIEDSMSRAGQYKAGVRQRAATAAREERDATHFRRATRAQLGSVGYSLARGAVGAATRLGADILGGAGVQTDVGEHVARNVELETRAQELANAGLDTSATGANAVRVPRAALMQQAREVGNATAMDPMKAMEGLQAFVGKTGDLETGRAILLDMAKLAKASGTSLEDMVDAAGDVSTQLGDIPDKGKVIAQVMGLVAGQGKKGAVEIRDMASQMAKLAAAAGGFEGDVAKNIGLMGVLAQESRQRGGSSSATQAATSVASFVNTFTKGARLGHFKAFGVNVQGAGGATRNAQDIILDSIIAASSQKRGGVKSMNENMAKMFSDVRARSVTRGFEQVYRQAYAGATGTEQEKVAAGARAVTAEFDRLKNAAIGQKELSQSFNDQMSTTASKVQLFNNAISKTTEDVQAALLPAFEEMTPAILNATHAFAWAIGKLAGKEEHDVNAADVSAFDRAAEATKVLNAAMKGSTSTLGLGASSQITLAPDTLKKSKAAEEDLGRAIERKQAAADEANSVLAFAQKQADKLGEVVPESVTEGAREANSDLASNKAQFDKLHELNERIAFLLENHVLQVWIKNPPAPETKPVTTDKAKPGRQAPEMED